MDSRNPRRIIKLGGHESDDPVFLASFAKAIEGLGEGTVIVHGGGATISELERQVFNREPAFVEGRRKTDGQTLALAEMVLCGAVNKKIVRSLLAHSTLRPLGLSGQDSHLLHGYATPELGRVAQRISADPKPILDLCSLGYTPVVAPISLDDSFEALNANADEAACALAKALAVDELIFLTNVPGVLVEGEIRSSLSPSEVEQLIEQNQITGGMIVKVRAAALAAIETGILVRICNLTSLNEGGGTILNAELNGTPDKENLYHNVPVQSIASQGKSSFIAPVYSRIRTHFAHARGMILSDDSRKSYLDFSSGIAVNALGHAHPKIVRALLNHTRQPLHVSNLYENPAQELLAEKLIKKSFAARAFFSNSGTEANEAALKFAMKYHHSRKETQRNTFLAFKGGFHGRTLGALSVTEKPAYRSPFSNFLSNTRFIEFNNTTELRQALDNTVAAVIVEPIQGESGIRLASRDFLIVLRELCDAHGVVLIFDEVQCGLMRTGTFWAHQWYGVEPDIITTAKPLGGGLPLGATLVSQTISETLAPGDHGSTFGGNPLACALANIVVDEVLALETHVNKLSERLKAALESLQSDFPQWINEIRGRGLMWGVDLKVPPAEFVAFARDRGLIVLTAGESTVRLLPPLICSDADIEEFRSLMALAFDDLCRKYADTIEVRLAENKDITDLVDLVSSFASRGQLLPRSLESIVEEIQNQNFSVAVWNETIVGCVAIRKWSDRCWETRSLAVIQSARGYGIGKLLARCVLQQAHNNQVPEVFALTRCADFFVGLGYQVVPRSKYPFKEKADCLGCRHFENCDEVAVGISLVHSHRSSSLEGENYDLV